MASSRRDALVCGKQLEQILAPEFVASELSGDRLGGIKHPEIAADTLALDTLEGSFVNAGLDCRRNRFLDSCDQLVGIWGIAADDAEAIIGAAIIFVAERIGDQAVIVQPLIQRRAGAEQRLQHQLSRHIAAQQRRAVEPVLLLLEAEQALGQRHLQLQRFARRANALRLGIEMTLDLWERLIAFGGLVGSGQLPLPPPHQRPPR